MCPKCEFTECRYEEGQDIFRSKGILAISGSDDRYVFQGVHMLMGMASSAEVGQSTAHVYITHERPAGCVWTLSGFFR